MANASAWAGVGTAIDASSRAADAWRRIGEKPTRIVLIRQIATVKTTLAAQTVRVEYDNPYKGEVKGGAGLSSTQRVTLFGIRDHETEADTDIQRDDRLALDGLQYRVVSVVKTLGEIQANCEAQG